MCIFATRRCIAVVIMTIYISVVTIEKSDGRPAEYAATFFANGASYKITINSGYVDGRADEAKETLIEILESFVF